MEKMTERQLIISTLRTLTDTINMIHQSVLSQEQFLTNNFRNYHSVAPSIWGQTALVASNITELEKLTQNNADNAHLLDKTGEEKSDVRYVEGDYPQNHSIQEAKRRLERAGYQMENQFMPDMGGSHRVDW